MRCIPTTREAVRQLLEKNTLNFQNPDAGYQGAECTCPIVANTVEDLLRSYLDNEDRVSKVQCCRAFYTVILLYSGTLIVFSPLVPAFHGKVLSDEADPVVDVAAGDYHIVFCTKSGAVYSCGYNNRYGQLGDGTVWDSLPDSQDSFVFNGKSKGCSIPPLLSSPSRVLGFYSLIPTLKESANGNNGERFETLKACENDGRGAPSGVGRISFTSDRSTVRICAVSCGAEHTLLLPAALNCVYSCGRGHCGQLGLRHCAILLQPVFRLIPLSFGLPIRQILATGHHSFFLTSTGRLFGFGENQSGQLGMGFTSNVFTPTPVRFLSALHRGKSVSEGENENASEESTSLMNKSPSKGSTLPLLDSRAYTTLYAPYASVESIYYPLRIKRLEVDLEPDEPFIEAVWGCSTITIALTNKLDWLSCGLPISRSWADQNSAKSSNSEDAHHGLYEPRHDGYGALGRPLFRVQDAWRFGYMAWSMALRQAINSLSTTNTENTTTPTTEPVIASVKGGDLLISQKGGNLCIKCVSYPHVSFVILEIQPVIPNQLDTDSTPKGKSAKSFIFLESSICEATFERIMSPNYEQGGNNNMDSIMPPHKSYFVPQQLLISTRLLLNTEERSVVNRVDFPGTIPSYSRNVMLLSLFEAKNTILPLRELIVLM